MYQASSAFHGQNTSPRPRALNKRRPRTDRDKELLDRRKTTNDRVRTLTQTNALDFFRFLRSDWNEEEKEEEEAKKKKEKKKISIDARNRTQTREEEDVKQKKRKPKMTFLFNAGDDADVSKGASVTATTAAAKEEKKKKNEIESVNNVNNNILFQTIPRLSIIRDKWKNRKIDRIDIPVVKTFSELYRHAEICSMSDTEVAVIEKWFRKYGETVRVLEIPAIDQRVIVAVNDKEKRITICLRGTKTLVNAAQNLRVSTDWSSTSTMTTTTTEDGTQQKQQQNNMRRFPKISFPKIPDAFRKKLDDDFPDFNVKMHRGYRTIALVVKREVSEFLKDGYEVDLQGHSLGGACALALALVYHHEGKTKVRRVVTFGSPKLGPKDTQDAAERAGLQILRVVQKDDIFPFLPMSRPGVTKPYVHCGDGIYLDSDQPGKFAELPRWYGGSGILWRQKAIVTAAYKSSLKKRNEILQSMDSNATTITPPSLNLVDALQQQAPVNESQNEKISAWVKRIRTQRFLKARQTLFSLAKEDAALASALDREEIKELSDANAGSFDDEEDSKLLLKEESGKLDIVQISKSKLTKMTVGPTIFERLRDLQKFDQKERVRRLECHRMVRYRDELKSIMDVGPQKVDLNNMFDDLYTTYRETKGDSNNVSLKKINTANKNNSNNNNINNAARAR
jgi:pimeloyl-ACP methyl ester carboxylesterase